MAPDYWEALWIIRDKEKYSTRKSFQCDIGLFLRMVSDVRYVRRWSSCYGWWVYFHYHRKGAEEIQSKPNWRIADPWQFQMTCVTRVNKIQSSVRLGDWRGQAVTKRKGNMIRMFHRKVASIRPTNSFIYILSPERFQISKHTCASVCVLLIASECFVLSIHRLASTTFIYFLCLCSNIHCNICGIRLCVSSPPGHLRLQLAVVNKLKVSVSFFFFFLLHTGKSLVVSRGKKKSNASSVHPQCKTMEESRLLVLHKLPSVMRVCSTYLCVFNTPCFSDLTNWLFIFILWAWS